MHRRRRCTRRPRPCADDGPGVAAPRAPAHTTSRPASARDPPRVPQARAPSRPRITALDRQRVTCVDAAGVNLAMTRLYGRAPVGERVVGSVPPHDGPQVTGLGALDVPGLHAVMTVDGATDIEGLRT